MRSFIMRLVLLLSVLPGPVWAQQAPAGTNDWQATFFGVPAVVLPILQAAAAKHSANLSALVAETNAIREDVQLARKDILGSVVLAGTYNYGNLNSGTLVDPNIPILLGAGSKIRHSVGINVNLPLDRLISRHHLIQRQELRVQQAELQRQDRENTLRQEVIRQYQEVLLTHKTLALYQQAYLAALTDHELVERQFRDGQTSLGELSVVNSRFSQAAIAQESAAAQYETSFLLLEELVGSHLSDLITSK